MIVEAEHIPDEQGIAVRCSSGDEVSGTVLRRGAEGQLTVQVREHSQTFQEFTLDVAAISPRAFEFVFKSPELWRESYRQSERPDLYKDFRVKR